MASDCCCAFDEHAQQNITKAINIFFILDYFFSYKVLLYSTGIEESGGESINLKFYFIISTSREIYSRLSKRNRPSRLIDISIRTGGNITRTDKRVSETSAYRRPFSIDNFPRFGEAIAANIVFKFLFFLGPNSLGKFKCFLIDLPFCRCPWGGCQVKVEGLFTTVVLYFDLARFLISPLIATEIVFQIKAYSPVCEHILLQFGVIFRFYF